MVSTSKTSLFSVSPEISALVRTGNQSIKGQPCLWLIHGSGGISSNDDLWEDAAIENGYTLIYVDSYSNRNVFKQHWDNHDEYRIPWDTRCADQIVTFEFLQNHQSMIPFADLYNSKVVGFSDGGTAAMLLQQTNLPDYWIRSYCLYPALPGWFIPSVNPLRNKVHLFVGEHDNWTPASDCLEFQAVTNCDLTILPDTHHSFSKPGINQWHENTFRTRTERGVFCRYSEESTKKVMDIVLR